MKFTSAGERGGTPLVQHDCPRYRTYDAAGQWRPAVYISAEPSDDDDILYQVPGCGCRPDKET